MQQNIKCQRKEIHQAGRDKARAWHYPQELKNKFILYKYAQHIFTKVHANAVELYKNPAKRREGKHQNAAEVAPKAAWAAVKNKYRRGR